MWQVPARRLETAGRGAHDASATGLGSGIDKDRPDYTVHCGEWGVGRIYETRGGPFWPMNVNGPMTRADRVATLEDASQFQKESWDAWKAWAKLEEVP